jgi:hypothetical protein
MIELNLGPDRDARADARERARHLVHALIETPAVPRDVREGAKEVRDDIRELCDRLDAAEVLLQGMAARVAEVEGELAAVTAERDELIAAGAIAGTVRMGPTQEETDVPPRARRRQ